MNGIAMKFKKLNRNHTASIKVYKKSTPYVDRMHWVEQTIVIVSIILFILHLFLISIGFWVGFLSGNFSRNSSIKTTGMTKFVQPFYVFWIFDWALKRKAKISSNFLRHHWKIIVLWQKEDIISQSFLDFLLETIFNQVLFVLEDQKSLECHFRWSKQ